MRTQCACGDELWSAPARGTTPTMAARLDAAGLQLLVAALLAAAARAARARRRRGCDTLWPASRRPAPRRVQLGRVPAHRFDRRPRRAAAGNRPRWCTQAESGPLRSASCPPPVRAWPRRPRPRGCRALRPPRRLAVRRRDLVPGAVLPRSAGHVRGNDPRSGSVFGQRRPAGSRVGDRRPARSSPQERPSSTR